MAMGKAKTAGKETKELQAEREELRTKLAKLAKLRQRGIKIDEEQYRDIEAEVDAINFLLGDAPPVVSNVEIGDAPPVVSNVETGQHTTERKTRRVTPRVRPVKEQNLQASPMEQVLQGIAALTKSVQDISGRVGDLEKRPAGRGSVPVQDSANVPTARQRSKAANERNQRRETFAGTAGVPVYDGTFEVSVSKKGHVQIAGFWHGKGVSVMSVERFAEFLRLLRTDDCAELVNTCSELGLFDDELAERIYE